LAKIFAYLKPLDYCIFVCALLVFGILLFITLRGREGEALVHITTQEEEYLYALSDDALLILDGPLGETEIAINNGSVRVLRSPGRRQICVNKGGISQKGEWLICLPNQVFVRIVAATESIDSYSY